MLAATPMRSPLFVAEVRGADKRPTRTPPTILDQDVQALLDEQVVIENNKTEREREHVVTCPDFEKFANGSLHTTGGQQMVP